MTQQSNPSEAWYDRTVMDRDGAKVGKVADVFLDHETQQPAGVGFGPHGPVRDSRRPLFRLGRFPGLVTSWLVPFEKAFVKDTPNVGRGEDLSEADEAKLAEYYGLQYSKSRSSSGLPSERMTAGDAAPREDDDAMTRSEEELRVGTVRRPSELVRLKKHVVTEPVQMTVPVQREEVRIERESITHANRAEAMSGAEITEAEHAVTLHEEEVVVDKKVVPKRARAARDRRLHPGGDRRRERAQGTNRYRARPQRLDRPTAAPHAPEAVSGTAPKIVRNTHQGDDRSCPKRPKHRKARRRSRVHHRPRGVHRRTLRRGVPSS